MVEIVANFELNNPEEIDAEFNLVSNTLDHSKLYNRDIADQHPISAITGLQTALADKQDILTSENAGTGISIETVDGVVKINNTQNSAEWGQIGGDINQQTDLKTALDNKQGKLTQVQLDAVNSGANTTNIGQIATNTSDIADINALIPNQATTSNQLADKNFVNSSIATNTAYFIGTFNSVAELEAYSGTLTNNDYAFVATTDTAGNTLYDRYKWNGSQWLFEYELNNSSFTADQWASINSGATATNIAKISTNETAINNHIANKNNPHEVTKAQVGLSNVDNTSDLNKPISTATQTALNAKQDTIADLSTIRSGAALGATAVQPETLTTELLKKQDVLTAGTDIEIVKGGSGILPQGFQQLEYIQGYCSDSSDSTIKASYIDTGIILPANANFYLKSQLAESPTTNSYLMCGTRTTTYAGSEIYIGSSNTVIDWYGSTETDRLTINNGGVAGDMYEIYGNNKTLTVFKNGSNIGFKTFNSPTTPTLTFWLNSRNTNNQVTSQTTPTLGRIYRFTVEGICDMIPAIRQSDSAIGMYDIIRNQFFANAGTGTFIAGPSTTLPNGYKQVEYIESTGTQYIDTGVIPTLNTKLIVKVTRIAVGGFAGSRDGADANSTMMSFGTNGTSVIVDFNNSQNTPYRVNYDAGAGAVTVIAETSKDARKLYDENGTLLAENTTVCSDTFTATKNMYLFSCNGASISNGCRFYYAQIWDGNTLIRDFVPCLDTNNVACMYDKVGKQTYYNAGTGEFTAGEVIGDELIINFTNESGYVKSSDLTGYEQTSNKVTSLSSSSTDTEYPSAKCVYDIVGDIETLINAL